MASDWLLDLIERHYDHLQVCSVCSPPYHCNVGKPMWDKIFEVSEGDPEPWPDKELHRGILIE